MDQIATDPKILEFLRTLERAELTLGELLYSLIRNRGPWLTNDLVNEVQKNFKFKNFSKKRVSGTLGAMKAKGLITKSNGGWMIADWQGML